MTTHETDDFKRAFYLDYFNNYLTVEKIAEHYGIDIDMANRFLESLAEEGEA